MLTTGIRRPELQVEGPDTRRALLRELHELEDAVFELSDVLPYARRRAIQDRINSITNVFCCGIAPR